MDLKPRYYAPDQAHESLYQIIDTHRSDYADNLAKIERYSSDIQSIRAEKQKNNIYWNNGFLPGLDIIILFMMIAEKKPKRFIEVGSGFSTRVADYSKTLYSDKTQIISIDPQPRTDVEDIVDKSIRQSFERLKFDQLQIEAGDILFIDNSHRILPNSDAMVFFMEVLPNLKKGVIVHLHDIYLPYDYPQFMCDRLYNEQYGLASYLLANPQRYKTIMPNYFVSQDEALSSIFASIWDHVNLEGVEKHGGSYWIEIC